MKRYLWFLVLAAVAVCMGVFIACKKNQTDQAETGQETKELVLYRGVCVMKSKWFRFLSAGMIALLLCVLVPVFRPRRKGLRPLPNRGTAPPPPPVSNRETAASAIPSLFRHPRSSIILPPMSPVMV